MTTIYKFQDTESVVTATSTTPLAFGDVTNVYSQTGAGARQATLGSVASFMTVTTATSATTATPISNFGYTSLGSSSGPVTTWTLAAPVSGVLKTIRNTSTSTAATVNTGSTGITFNSTGANQVSLSGSLAFIDLIGVSTTAWHITAQSSAGTLYSTF